MKAPLSGDVPNAKPTVDDRTTLWRFAFAVAAIALAFAARWALDPVMGDKHPFGTVIIAITLTAWYAGFAPSLLAFFLGFFLADWFFVAPRHSFSLRDTTHIAGNLSYLFVSMSIILFGRSLHLARRRADENAREARNHEQQLEQEVVERRRAEEEVRRLNAELERRVETRTAELQATNEELESFTYSVSHDLRAPLRHVDGYAKILQEELGPQLSPEAQEFIRRIRQGSQNMGQLVDDLLNLSQLGKQELARTPVALRSLVEEAMAEVKLEAPGREIEWQIGELPRLDCDAGLVKQALINLLSNAVKYTRKRAPARIEIGQVKLNGETAICVRDNGVGFNMEYSDKLFGMFQRLHRAEEFEGTGVGLATVARIVRKHGGRIWAEAEVNKGAAFFFSLDAAKSGGAKNHTVPGSLEPAPLILPKGR